jgi:hypothetical protein
MEDHGKIRAFVPDTTAALASSMGGQAWREVPLTDEQQEQLVGIFEIGVNVAPDDYQQMVVRLTHAEP